MLFLLTAVVADAACSIVHSFNMFLCGGAYKNNAFSGFSTPHPINLTTSSAWQQFNHTMNNSGSTLPQRGKKRKAIYECLEINTKKQSFDIMARSPLQSQTLDANFMLKRDMPDTGGDAPVNSNMNRDRFDGQFYGNNLSCYPLRTYRETSTATPRLPVRARRPYEASMTAKSSSNNFSAAKLDTDARRAIDFVDVNQSAARSGIYRNDWTANIGSAQVFTDACVASYSKDGSSNKVSQQQQHDYDMRINNTHNYPIDPYTTKFSSNALMPLAAESFVRSCTKQQRGAPPPIDDADIVLLGEKTTPNHIVASQNRYGLLGNWVRKLKGAFLRDSLDAAPRTSILTPPPSSMSIRQSTDLTEKNDAINQLLQQLRFDSPEVQIIDERKIKVVERWDVFELDDAVVADAVNKMSAAGKLDDEFVRKFHIPILRKDLRTLYRAKWLNDEVCNFYFEMIKDRNERAVAPSPSSSKGSLPNGGPKVAASPVAGGTKRLPKVHIFNTHFFKLYIERGYDHVKKWTKKFDLFAMDMVLIPVNLTDSHWTIIRVDFRNKSIFYYDSLYAGDMGMVEDAKAYIASEHMDKKKVEFDFTGWTVGIAKHVPRQKNGFDCGVFMCRIADCLAADQPLNFTQDDMQFFRTRMACEILEQKLYSPCRIFRVYLFNAPEVEGFFCFNGSDGGWLVSMVILIGVCFGANWVFALKRTQHVSTKPR